MEKLQECQALAHKRNGKCLSEKYTHSRIKMLWECTAGHVWAATMRHIELGYWCPVCITGENNSLASCQQLATSRKGKCLSKEYKNNYTPMLWECSEGHVWQARFNNVKNNNTWCQICQRQKPKRPRKSRRLEPFVGPRKPRTLKKKYTVEDCQRLAAQKGGKYLHNTFDGVSASVQWTCNCGHIWTTSFTNIRRGTWCPYCQGLKKHTILECQELARHKGGQCLESNYVSNNVPMRWQCAKGHMWAVRFCQLTLKGTWCPVCGVEKAKQTNLIRYGSENPFGSREIMQRIKDTNQSKFGVDHPSKNYDIALKIARSVRRTVIKRHWETNEELVCQGSWEAKVVDYLNDKRERYLWQSKCFTLTDGKTYRPDLYLIDRDVWVEIKGYFREKAKAKWLEFLQSNPTAELWDKFKLHSLGIMVR